MKQPHSIRRRLWLGSAVALALAAAGLLAWQGMPALAGGPPAGSPAPVAAPAATPVSTALVLQREVTRWNEFSGRLEAIDRVVIRSRVAGVVQQVHFREGALVRRGDPLVTIDPAPFAADVERAEGQVASAQARVAHADGEYARARSLWDERAVSRREVDESLRAKQEAGAQLRSAAAALQSARLSLGYTRIAAPVSGRAGRLETTVGNLTGAGAEAAVLTTIVSVSPIYATFDADEAIVSRALKDLADRDGARNQLSRIAVRMGTAATADTPHEGHLQLVDNQVDAGSGTVRLRAVFDNPDGSLMPGQFARLRMGHPVTTPALLVTERAVGTDQSRKFVLVVGEDNVVSYREVSLGDTVDGLRVVTSGLKAGERIVVNGLHRVRPGAVVDPATVAMDGKADVRKAEAAPGRGSAERS